MQDWQRELLLFLLNKLNFGEISACIDWKKTQTIKRKRAKNQKDKKILFDKLEAENRMKNGNLRLLGTGRNIQPKGVFHCQCCT